MAVISVFLFGSPSVMMSFIRIHLLFHLQSLFNTFYQIGEIAIVAALELDLATITMSLAAIRALWVKGSRS
jgi:hypothetical protein